MCGGDIVAERRSTRQVSLRGLPGGMTVRENSPFRTQITG